jgi:hypothetical protein
MNVHHLDKPQPDASEHPHTKIVNVVAYGLLVPPQPSEDARELSRSDFHISGIDDFRKGAQMCAVLGREFLCVVAWRIAEWKASKHLAPFDPFGLVDVAAGVHNDGVRDDLDNALVGQLVRCSPPGFRVLTDAQVNRRDAHQELGAAVAVQLVDPLKQRALDPAMTS